MADHMQLVRDIGKGRVATPTRRLDITQDNGQDPRLWVSSGIDNRPSVHYRANVQILRKVGTENGRFPVGWNFVHKSTFERPQMERINHGLRLREPLPELAVVARHLDFFIDNSREHLDPVGIFLIQLSDDSLKLGKYISVGDGHQSRLLRVAGIYSG
jgi:hypothetical protein